MTANRNRTRLGLEQIEGRCMPSAVLGDPLALAPVNLGGTQASHVGSREAGRHEAAPRQQVEAFRLNFQCTSNLNSGGATVTGFATNLGHWTGQGTVTGFEINPAADRASLSGTVKVVTAQGEIYANFSTMWKLSTGKGIEVIQFTGGTGRYAGVTGFATMKCNITLDQAAQTFSCDCRGAGLVVYPRR